MILLVIICQSVVYREVTSLFTLRGESESEDPWRKTLNWYFFAVINYFLYGESIIYYFKVRDSFLIRLIANGIAFDKHVMFADVLLLPFATNHRLISFMLYTIGVLVSLVAGSRFTDICVGFVGFVASLKKQYLKQQFGMFCWVHMSLLVIVVSRSDLAYWEMNIH